MTAPPRAATHTAVTTGRRQGQSLAVERLEYRDACAVLAGETVVNMNTARDQSEPAVAALPNGASVVVWSHSSQEGDSDVYLQRYSANGARFGIPVAVASTGLDEVTPDVAFAPNGNIIVTWVTREVTGIDLWSGTYYYDEDVVAQIFGSDLRPKGEAFHVGFWWEKATYDDTAPSIACDATGAFVIAYNRTYEGYARPTFNYHRYNAAGVLLSYEGALSGGDPDVAMAPDGRFNIVVGGTFRNTGPVVLMYAYDRMGSNRGGAGNFLLVGQRSESWVSSQKISMDANGNSVVVWTKPAQGHSDVLAKRFSNGLVPSRTWVVAGSSGNEIAPGVAVNRAGTRFVVTHYNTTTSRVHVTEMAMNGVIRYRFSAAMIGVGSRSSLAFDAGSSYQIVYDRPAGFDGSREVFRRRGRLS